MENLRYKDRQQSVSLLFFFFFAFFSCFKKTTNKKKQNELRKKERENRDMQERIKKLLAEREKRVYRVNKI